MLHTDTPGRYSEVCGMKHVIDHKFLPILVLFNSKSSKYPTIHCANITIDRLPLISTFFLHPEDKLHEVRSCLKESAP